MEDCIVTKIQSKIKRNTRKKRIRLTFSSDGDPRATYRCKLDNNVSENCKLWQYSYIIFYYYS